MKIQKVANITMESQMLAINVVHFNNWFFFFYKIVKEEKIYDDCDLWIKK